MTTREEFEAWAAPRGYEVGHKGAVTGDYLGGATAIAWEAWKASRTATLEEAAKECDLFARHWLHSIGGFDKADAAEQCALGIRALK